MNGPSHLERFGWSLLARLLLSWGPHVWVAFIMAYSCILPSLISHIWHAFRHVFLDLSCLSVSFVLPPPYPSYLLSLVLSGESWLIEDLPSGLGQAQYMLVPYFNAA